MKALFLLILLFSPLSANALSSVKIEHYLLNMLRQTREKHKLPPLRVNTKLIKTARYQSEQMARKNFFSHIDPEGHGPRKRMSLLFPEIIGGIGENIAYNYGHTDEEAAKKIFKAWMHSPGHRANILSKTYNSIGIGVAFKGRRVYATQEFGMLIAELYASNHASLYGDVLIMKFRSLLYKGKKNLSVMIKFPNAKARYYTKNGVFYTGTAVMTPQWIDKSHFIIRLGLNYGHGTYRIFMGQGNNFYKGFDFIVK